MSLRWRLLLAFTLLIAATVTAVVIASQRIVREEFRDFTEMRVPPRGIELAIAREFLLGASLDSLEQRYDRTIVIVNPENKVAQISSRVPGVQIEAIPSGGLKVIGGRGGSHTLSVFKGASVPIPPLGTLHAIPKIGAPPEPDFAQRLNRSLLIALIVLGIIAIGLSAVLASRITRPLEQLTVAANRVAAGDLRQHVPVKTRDEVGKLANAFNVMSAQLATNETVRRNMVNDVAHELRTPLTNLRCSIESMQDGLRPTTPEAINALHEDVMLLQRLVDDLQTLALAEAGKLPFHPERVNLKSALSRFNDPRVRIDVPDSIEIEADPTRLHQIVSNLVRNALTANGSVVITASTGATGAVQLTVSDDGDGIAPEHLPHIFDRFYRADESRQRSSGGAGLGLAIVKQLVTLQGGTISVASEPQRGTTFTIVFPR